MQRGTRSHLMASHLHRFTRMFPLQGSEQFSIREL
jgi:hypothetical protein